MTETNYYERNSQTTRDGNETRHPTNHVQFSSILRPLDWLDRLIGEDRFRPFSLSKIMLAEFDRGSAFDSVLGTKQELSDTRKLVEIAANGFDNNPHLSPSGRLLLKLFSMNLLKNRHRVLTFYHNHRDYIDKNGKMAAPLIITGLPRSGTTLLQRLISEDPLTRSPYTFELESPLPPLTKQQNPLTDPRIKASASSLRMLARLAPGFIDKLNQSHYWSATEMEESLIYMLAHNGIPMMNGAHAGHNFMDHFLNLEGKRSIFQYERLFFSILDAYKPAKSHWTLKAPNYAPWFPLIFDAYPDARVVVTHRNPLVTLPSYCRLMESWCIPCDRNGSFDKHTFARLSERFIAASLNTPLQFRNQNPHRQSQIFDCMYAELFSDPIGMVRSVYKKFNLEYTTEFENRMKIYLNENQAGKYGRHNYSLEEYGFSADEVYQSYQTYMQSYGFTVLHQTKRPSSLGSDVSSG